MTDHPAPAATSKKAPSRPFRLGDLILNLLTVFALLATLLSLAAFGVLFLVPTLIPSPFRPPDIGALPPTAFIPTSTATPIFPTLPPAWTTTATILPTETRPPTESPTITLTPSPTLTATDTPGPTATGPTVTATRTLSALPYTLQGDAPVPLSNFANNEGCNWMGIAGQVFGANDEGVPGLIVHLEGGGDPKDTLTGSKPEYGSAGYEFVLGNHPVETGGVYRVQLRNPDGSPLSDVVVVNTFADCSKNLLLVNFVRNH